MKTKPFTIYDLRFTRRSRVSSGSETQGQPFNGPCPPESTPGLQSRKSEIVNRKSQEGIALVITLILLSVTLVMAVAFLAISRRERGSVSTSEDTAAAKFAADAALSSAEARIVSQILTTTNPYVFSLLVSTNYINRIGFVPGSGNPTNVNYDYYAPAPFGPGGNGLSAADLEQNIANLYYNPRPPVFYGSNDFRYYLDLNRNGMYDTNGWVTNTDNRGNGLGTVSLEVGDPEWIGVLAHPDQPHGPNNPFIARYCFIAVPANSLDLNYIHNAAMAASSVGNNLSVANDGYFRNQGVGTWELNLAAFLTDLNSNIWDPQGGGNEYQYREPAGFGNSGVAFFDAFDLLTNRYANFYPSQPSVQSLFGGRGDNAFNLNGVDAYTRGPIETAFDANYASENLYPDYWVGAENTNNFFTPDDLFNTNETANFGIHLQNAGVNTVDAGNNPGTTVSTYDRYTFYRMLGQLGTDTQPASGKVNLNYQNALVTYDTTDTGGYGPAAANVARNITIVPNYETNFFNWTPQDFFTVAANQMLRAYTTEWFEASPSNYMQNYYGITEPYYTNMDGVGVTNIQYYGQTNQIPAFGITNIPVYVNGAFVYSPAVNRILQLAANIYDATTNTTVPLADSNYPSVFRPIFDRVLEHNYFLGGEVFTNIYIRGFQYVHEPLVTGDSASTLFAQPIDLNQLLLRGANHTYSTNNVWGVPWIVGAKKGLPNFNGFELDNSFFIERELQFNRNNNTPEAPSGNTFPYGRTYTTNQMYLMGISNAFAMDDWNSYANSYNNKVTIYAYDDLSIGLTNSDGYNHANMFLTNAWTVPNSVLGISTPVWPSQVFAQPFGTNITVMQNLSYSPVIPSTNGVYLYYAKPTPVPFGPYSFTGPCFIPSSLDPSNYLDSGTPPLPIFNLVTTNHLQAYMLDTDPNGNVHILDYVQLGSMNSALNINAAILDNDDSGLWSTNPYTGSTTPWGVVQQYLTSEIGGGVPQEDADGGGAGGQWAQTAVPGTGGDTSQAAQQAYFSAFFSADDTAFYNGVPITNIELSMQAPFTPMRQIIQRYVFQANDPLVHYLSSDLNDIGDDSTNRVAITTVQTNNIKTIGIMSDRYLPWGGLTPGSLLTATPDNLLRPANVFYGNPAQTYAIDQNQYNFAYRDPLVWSPDNWDFPTNKFPSVGWLGRVHRGTPWQSVYLKSTNIWSLAGGGNGGISGPATWEIWTGDVNADDAYNEIPAQDRLLFDIFTATPDDDATRGQVSVNIGADDPTNMLAGLASWSALLSGTVTFSTNTTSGYFLSDYPGYQNPSPVWQQTGPYFAVVTNQPMGAVGTPSYNPALAQIVEGINSTRTNFTSIDGLHGVFEHAGDILATPELSDGSPYLGFGDSGKIDYAVSDEMYEWLPQQMLGLMTVSGTPQNPPRYVVYCYGQTLKPAPNGIVESGTFAGLCTNYQVTAESAARVVITVQNNPTPGNPTATPHIVVQQYNTLPPD